MDSHRSDHRIVYCAMHMHQAIKLEVDDKTVGGYLHPRTHARTHGRTSRKHNAFDRVSCVCGGSALCFGVFRCMKMDVQNSRSMHRGGKKQQAVKMSVRLEITYVTR